MEITGLYRPADTGAPYWRLDDLGGRGVKKGDFTTYGPLLAASGTLTGGRVSAGPSGWLAAADFSTLTADRTGALREAAREGTRWLRGRPVLSGTTAARTSLPEVLDRLDRSLVVARSTLLVIALQLALLAVCALLLVARLLSAERAGELRLLRARGASRARLAGLSALEALLLAAPAALAAPLLAGPLTRLLAGQGPLARIGLRPQVPFAGDGTVRWVALAVALGCALAVTLPAPASSPAAGGRARPLPAPVRAGADLALLAVAGVAYWQLSGQRSGAVTADTSGGLGVDPLLVAAPALALLAGTVLTLRLLPPVARLAERRAAGGRGLTAALAGWQLSRRPARGTGPVLLLVLAVALGTLAVGQGASWDRSQDDQADFRAGAPVRAVPAPSGRRFRPRPRYRPRSGRRIRPRPQYRPRPGRRIRPRPQYRPRPGQPHRSPARPVPPTPPPTRPTGRPSPSPGRGDAGCPPHRRPAPPRPARPVAPVPAPWTRTRLRTAPGAAAALALLVAVTVCWPPRSRWRWTGTRTRGCAARWRRRGRTGPG
ncbi:hypothetical protein SFUMM280S_04105 [Streptomyces fumanus]